jgi:hypothetical protein
MSSRTLVLIFAAACGGKKDAPPASDPGPSGSDGGSAQKPPVSVDAAVAAKTPDAAAPGKPQLPGTCIPSSDDVDRIAFGRIGGQLVACAGDHACWNLDGKTGAVARRDALPLPGVGFYFEGKCYRELCTPSGEEGDGGFVAFHPDGKRAATMVGREISVFDLATKKITSSFAFEISNTPSAMWFVGNSLFVRGDDAGPASYLHHFGIDGKKVSEAVGIFHGGVAVSDDTIVVQLDGIESVIVLDGRKASTKLGPRKVPAGPCKAGDHAEWRDYNFDDTDPNSRKCFEYIKKHYVPYEDAQLVPDDKGFVGFTRDSVFTLDAKLVETSRVRLAQCRK